jgi:hypothetical protein
LQPDPPEKIYKAGEDGIQPPRPLNGIDAEPPPEARAKQLNGRCIISLTVGVDGKPRDIVLIRCTDPVFAPTALSRGAKYLFKPAVTSEGKPVATKITIEVNFQSSNPLGDLKMPIRYAFTSPPGALSSEPDANGVYPLTTAIAPPTIVYFADEGYGDGAFRLGGDGACDILLTLDAKGRPLDPQVIHCEKPALEKLAAQSLLKSHYKPGRLNGKAVPVKLAVHLGLGGFASSN